MHRNIRYNSKLDKEDRHKKRIPINLIHKLLLLFPWVLNKDMRMLRSFNPLKIVNHIYFLLNINFSLLKFNSNLLIIEIRNNSIFFRKDSLYNSRNKLLIHHPLFNQHWCNKTHKKLSIIPILLLYKRNWSVYNNKVLRWLKKFRSWNLKHREFNQLN